MSEPGSSAPAPTEFNEAAYMVAFPRIAESIRSGLFKSALDHYTRRGEADGRLAEPRYVKALEAQRALTALSPPAATAEGRPRGKIDAMLVADNAACLVIGWADDRLEALRSVDLRLANGRLIASTGVARNRRTDAEAMIGCPPGYLLGFSALLPVYLADALAQGGTLVLNQVSYQAKPRLLPAVELREIAFDALAGSNYYGNPAVEMFRQMDHGYGTALLALNRGVSIDICKGAYVERHGTERPFRASVVVCLYGRIEYLFLQAAFFSAGAAAQDIEFIYVCNSPELSEALQREARIAARLYGIAITLVLLPGNAGFAAANNAAAQHARSSRLLILNPDVFPRDANWAIRHAQIVDGLPKEQTRLFGAPLFYDDGSLMHGGMFFAVDAGLSVQPDAITRQDLLRVEHYGKGAPPDTPLYHRSRQVPAVTGAFMSTDRAFFEKLGGFTEDYAFGHYEDADLCLKSWRAGQPVWLHDFPLWHMEGKGSVRRSPHEGGSMANRWHFTKTWLDMVQDGFAGPQPARLPAT